MVRKAILIPAIVGSATAFQSPAIPPQLRGHQRSEGKRGPFNLGPLPKQPGTALSLSLGDVDGSGLTNYFLETLISTGVPAIVSIAVIGFAAKAFRGDEKQGGWAGEGYSNPVDELYDDLYTDGPSPSLPSWLSPQRRRRRSPNSPPSRKNIGIPAQQYLTVTNLNSKLDSYRFSLTSATRSKAAAASELRNTNFKKAFQLGIDSSIRELTREERADLILEEREFLRVGGALLEDITKTQKELTDGAILDEIVKMEKNRKVNKLIVIDADVEDPAEEKGEIATGAVVNETAANVTNVSSHEKAQHKGESPVRNVKDMMSKKSSMESIKKLESLNTDLVKLELEFVKAVVEILGPERATGIRTAILGNINGGGGEGAGSLLRNLQERPLATILADIGYTSPETRQKSLFVTEFPGDVTASQVSELREEVTAIVRSAQPGDEALLVLQSGGGTVTGYGLAAAQLQRLREHGMKLTICVEQVAASGGYMMCCVADRIVASPFAVLGSIGVISDMPNVYERLKKEGVEFQTVTAGKYKRTITPTKKVTKEDLDKSKQDVEDILVLFKKFVKENRPNLDIETVATGETWFGSDAMERGLCDEIKTADDILIDFVDQGYNVYDVKYAPPQPTLLGNLAPVGVDGRQNVEAVTGLEGIGRKAISWIVRNVVSEAKAEIAKELTEKQQSLGGTTGASNMYMMKDDTADRIKMQD